MTATALDHATAVLDGTTSLRGSIAARAGAFLTRSALESVVRELCSARGCPIVRASERSRLLVLRHLYGDDVADLACAAWHGLSDACHHHAYELSPSGDDVRRWHRMVITLDSMRSIS